jgi:hypothetical protein
MVAEASFTFNEPEEYTLPIFERIVDQRDPLMSTEALEKWAGQLGNVSTADFTSTFQNVFQAIYHLVCVDLGVILDNHIYNSSQMFNLSTMPVNLPAVFSSSSANKSCSAASNLTLMAQWRQKVAFYNTSVRVPVMDCLQPVPHLKPLGSAITSVFVSTFSMLSALWTIFSLGPGMLARRTLLITFALLSHVKTLKDQPDNDCPCTQICRKKFLVRVVGLLPRDSASTYMQKTLDRIWASHPALLFTRSLHQWTFASSI